MPAPDPLPPPSAPPAKCVHCRQPMTGLVLCDACERINPPLAGTDFFALLGLPRQFPLDGAELHRRYIALSRAAHPDFHAAATAEVQELAQTVSTSLNDAYRTLADPARRAGYLLELLGGPSSADDKSVPEGFLASMMMLQEELADAQASGEAAPRQRVADVLATQREGLMNRVAGLFADLSAAAGCEAARQDLLAQIRRQLNAAAYVRKLASQASGGPVALGPPPSSIGSDR